MPISSFLRDQRLDPEAIEAMSQAFQNACRALGLADRDNALNELIAKKVIELARSGMRNPIAISLLTVKEFKSNPQ